MVENAATDWREGFPMRLERLAPPRPFLVPSIDGEPVEILPSEKPNMKIRWDSSIHVQEIQNRYANMSRDEDDDSYEIEIVEDDGDADFYLEVVDGEVYYVFETEDDISIDSMEAEDSDSSSDSETTSEAPFHPMQLDINRMSTPNLDMSSQNFDFDPSDLESDGDTFPSEPKTDKFEKERMLEVDEGTDTSARDDGIIEETEPVDITDKKEELNERANLERKTGMEARVDSDEAGESSKPVKLPPSVPMTITVKKEEPEQLTLSPTPTPTTEADSAPSSPVADTPAKVSPKVSPGSSPHSPTRSILKPSPASPRKEIQKSPKKPKKPKGEKTFTKTYVRADNFDGEHRVYTWEKPQWTTKQLKSTGKGDAIRQGGNLANPITFPKEYSWKHNVLGTDDQEEETTENETMDKAELIAKLLQNGTNKAQLPRYGKNQSKLRVSVHGAKIRDGSDIVKPITKATVLRKPEDVNHIANPEILKSTPTGNEVRSGKSLAGPITKATVLRTPEDVNHVANKNVLRNKGINPAKNKQYEWEKPEWTQPKLHSTDKGELVKKGESVAKPVTHINRESIYGWEKPSWTEKAKKERTLESLDGSSHHGDSLSSSSHHKKYEWEKPNWTQKERVLKMTKSGDVVRHGDDLAAPITQLPALSRTKSHSDG